jgi:hypothetical protein
MNNDVVIAKMDIKLEKAEKEIEQLNKQVIRTIQALLMMKLEGKNKIPLERVIDLISATDEQLLKIKDIDVTCKLLEAEAKLEKISEIVKGCKDQGTGRSTIAQLEKVLKLKDVTETIHKAIAVEKSLPPGVLQYLKDSHGYLERQWQDHVLVEALDKGESENFGVQLWLEVGIILEGIDE